MTEQRRRQMNESAASISSNCRENPKQSEINLSKCHFDHHESATDWPEKEHGPARVTLTVYELIRSITPLHSQNSSSSPASCSCQGLGLSTRPFSILSFTWSTQVASSCSLQCRPTCRYRSFYIRSIQSVRLCLRIICERT